jgi:hypothetical protein
MTTWICGSVQGQIESKQRKQYSDLEGMTGQQVIGCNMNYGGSTRRLKVSTCCTKHRAGGCILSEAVFCQKLEENISF